MLENKRICKNLLIALIVTSIVIVIVSIVSCIYNENNQFILNLISNI